MEGLRNNCLEWSVRRRRRSATTSFIVEASFVLQETEGVLSNPEQGVARLVPDTAASSVASWRAGMAKSRSELVIAPPCLWKR